MVEAIMNGMVEAIYLDTRFANADQPKIIPSYAMDVHAASIIPLTNILRPQAADVEARPFIEPVSEERGVIEEYRAGRTRPLSDFIAELEARGEI